MQHDAFSLLELNTFVREAVKGNFPDRYKVVAEIASFYENKTGHCYLELIQKGKDDRIVAKAGATIWSYSYRMLKPYFESSTGRTLSCGLSVLLDVSIEFHEVYGYSLNIRDIDPAYTIGEAALQKQETIKRLQQEDIFDANRFLQEPALFQRIAVISSPTAAGYEDFCKQLTHNPFQYVFYMHLFPAVMQGDQASSSIAKALEKIAAHQDMFDVIVIIRGGGAKSDLQCFDYYEMASAVARSPLPVITGIGHERDESVVDMVAFHAMKTPTAVAEYLIIAMQSREQYMDEMHEALTGHVLDYTRKRKREVHTYTMALNRLIKDIMLEKKMKIYSVKDAVRHQVHAYLERRKSALSIHEKSLYYMDPVNILKKGYSYTTLNGKILKSHREVKKGDVITTRLRNGEIISKVIE